MFEAYLVQSAERIEGIRQSAYELHRSVNQTYGDSLPYGYHLDMVVNAVREFGYLFCTDAIASSTFERILAIADCSAFD